MQTQNSPERKTILIVEDNELNMTLWNDVLEVQGYALLKTALGIEGVRLARERLPDLILLDSMKIRTDPVNWRKGGILMPDEPQATIMNRELATKIVTAYVRRNQIGADQIGSLISARLPGPGNRPRSAKN